MYNARIKLPAHFTQSDMELLSVALNDFVSAHTAIREHNNDNDMWVLDIILEEKPDISALSDRLSSFAEYIDLGMTFPQESWEIEEIEDIDWLTHSYKQFPPFSIGPFFIYGSHYDGSVPDGQMGLQIDAARAFGSGEHGTTKGCIMAMLDLKGQGVCPWNVLDVGTGSGILAIAGWKLWKTMILAVDIDEEAVRVAVRHQESNKIPSGSSDLTCAHSEGFAADIVQKKAPYELIIANILAGPLKEMAADLKAALDQNAYVILSGIVQEQADSVIKVYENQQLTLKKRYDIGEWVTLVMHNA